MYRIMKKTTSARNVVYWIHNGSQRKLVEANRRTDKGHIIHSSYQER